MIERFFPNSVISSQLALSADASQAFFIATIDGRMGVWTVPTMGDRSPRHIVSLDGYVLRTVAVHGSGAIYLCADPSGSEAYEIFEVGADCVRRILGGEGSSFFLDRDTFSPDGRYMALAGAQEGTDSVCIYCYELGTGTLRCVAPDEGHRVPVGWTAESDAILVSSLTSSSQTQLELCYVDSGERRTVSPDGTTCSPACWWPETQNLLVLTDEGRDYQALMCLDMSAGLLTSVEAPHADVTHAACSADGRFVAWVVNESGWERLYLRDMVDGSVWSPAFNGLFDDVLFGFGHQLFVVVAGPTTPTQVVRVDAESRFCHPLTAWPLPHVEPQELITSELISFHSFDHREITGFLYKPRAACSNDKSPVVIAVHGGPEDQERAGFSALYQCLLYHGVGVFAPNIRGSTGFGADFQKLVYRDWGGGDIQDVARAADFLRTLPWVDGERIGIMGASYGGFVALLAAARLPDCWAAVVDLFGPTNLITFVKNVPDAWQRYMRDLVGDPDEDAAFLLERSPATYAAQITAPTLIIHGENDPRVPLQESETFVAALHEAGRNVEFMIVEGEGHGIFNPEHQSAVMNKVVSFLVSALGR